MELTTLSKNSTNLFAALALTACIGTASPAESSQAEDAPHAEASGSSTLVILDSHPDSADIAPAADNFAQTLNRLRPAATNQQTAKQHPNTLRNGLSARPAQATQPRPKVMAAANVNVSEKTVRSIPEIRQPTNIQPTSSQRVTSRTAPLPVQQATPRQLPKPADNSVRVAKHQEAVTPAAQNDPVVELLLRANKLSQRATTEQHYTTIIGQCNEAIRNGVSAEHRRYARQLSSWALNRRGQLHAEEGEESSADADFRTALDYHPNNWRAIHNRGVSFAQRGQFAEAFDDFNEVIKLNPQHAKAYTNRATLYLQTNDLEAALEDFQQALENDPELVTAQIGISRTCHRLGRWEEAYDHFSVTIALDPTNASVVCSRGDLLADMGRYREAMADYARTIELNPKFAHAYRNGAWLLATCPDGEYRDADNAILGAEQALEFDYGDRHVALDTLAAALANAGKFKEATSILQEAIEIAPADAKVNYLSRLQLYQDHQPFRTQPIGDIAQAVYEVSDQ